MAMPESDEDAIYRASVDALSAIAQVGTPGWRGPSATAVRGDMMAVLKTFVSRCREASIPEGEIAEARYALVAFIDDRILRQVAWPGRAEWMQSPLQLQFFREYTAGENFFARMRSLAQRGPPPFALEVYFLCIALGFVGAQSTGSQPLQALAESVLPEIVGPGNRDRIAPRAVPPERIRAQRAPFPVVTAIVIACALVTLGGLVALQLSIGAAVDRATVALAPAGGPPPTRPGR
jgi:type VI secretion system protein ImpK